MRIDYTVPQKWNDLSDWQLRMIGHFLFLNHKDETDKSLFRHVFLFILFLPKPSFWNLWKLAVLLFKFSFKELEHYTDFIFDKKQLLTRFPRHIKVGRFPFRKKLYGPADRLANVTISEFSYADTFYDKWIRDGETDELHRLTAILYRPKSKTPNQEDLRTKFSSLTLGNNSKTTDHIPLHIKYMIAHCYQGCREIIVNRHPNVFPKRKIIEGQEDSVVKRKPYQTFSKIIDSMAMDEIQVFGTHQETENIFVPKFLQIFEAKIIKQKQSR
jgi:hypothetical protein